MNLQDYKIWENPHPIDIEITESEELTNGNWLKTEKITYLRNSVARTWEMISRGQSDWVATVLPVTSEWNIILLEELRIPLMKAGASGRTIWMPAWLINIGDSRDNTARKELEEEVWFTSDEIIHVDTVTSSEWMTDEEVDVCIALNCKKVTDLIEWHKQVWGLILGHEDWENITSIYSVPYSEIDNFLDQAKAEGMKKWSKIDCALRHYEKKYLNLI